jgi:lipopolysaccharide transport system ATP-binding protein
MTQDIAIRVQGLSKCYQIYDNPGDRLKQFVYPRIKRLLGRVVKPYFRDFWAVKEVSFEVKRGETVGIIGRNGSGKSTLLQMICGTLTPTSGTIQTHGRIAALLELGSGFNPEFTGRENIFLNAAVMGMTKEETDARYDAIVEFSEIGDFIDQPVKSYSSGMYVRLAFSVAVHVDPEILIIDEALSVGDIFFQTKCMRMMHDMMNRGVSVLFVTHDTNTVKSFCDRALYLENGHQVAFDKTEKVVELYYSKYVEATRKLDGLTQIDNLQTEPEQYLLEANTSIVPAHVTQEQLEQFAKKASFQRIKNHKADFLYVGLYNAAGREIEQVDFGEPISIRMTLTVNVDIHALCFAYHIRDRNGLDIAYSDTGIENKILKNLNAGEQYIVDWGLPANLKEGNYSLAAMLSIPINLQQSQVDVCDFVPLAGVFRVSRGEALPMYGSVYINQSVLITKL